VVENRSTDVDAGDVWTVARVLDWTVAHLKTRGSDTPRLDAEILLAYARNCERIKLYTQFAEPLSPPQRSTMRDLVKRRAAAEPVAYLVKHREFFSLDFQLTPDVLIPRPDTETLVVELLERSKSNPTARILDVGTGSGCIAVTAAVHCPNADVTATDISEKALIVAHGNAEQHCVEGRIRFLHGDLLAALPMGEHFDFIVSNPPYIREDEYPTLQPEVRLHEPKLALVAGADGLSVVRRLIEQAAGFLVSGGALLLEIAHEQAQPVRELLQSADRFTEIELVNDLSGQPRVACARSTG